jgi:acyl-CoA reductase-like NAD-dependent aldehyde dehydrogenase
MATNEVESAGAFITGISALDLPEEIVEDNANRKVVTRHTPLGVVAAIVPWNFPIQLGKLKFNALTT